MPMHIHIYIHIDMLVVYSLCARVLVIVVSACLCYACGMLVVCSCCDRGVLLRGVLVVYLWCARCARACDNPNPNPGPGPNPGGGVREREREEVSEWCRCEYS